MTALEEELEEARRLVSADGYPMSIGELTNMYRDEELVIRPPFQRLFRWDDEQKSRLVESILIGIPLPSVFVAQDDEGRWELIDGLQRVSTLLQLQGELDAKEFPPLELSGTKYLPALEGLTWENSENPERALTVAQRRDIKRSKIDLKIIQRKSDVRAKFDLFQRLNSFGSKLSNQEIRNAQLVGVNPEFVEWLTELASFEPFATLLKLPEGDVKRKYNEELALRFLYLHDKSLDEIKAIQSFQEGLNEFATETALNFTQEYKQAAESTFKRTFDQLLQVDEGIFGRWSPEKENFRGGFLNSAFEVFAVGLGHLIHSQSPLKPNLRQCAIDLWSEDGMRAGFATGKSTEARLKRLIPLGRQVLRA